MGNGELTELEELQLKHRELDQAIQEGYSRYMDDVELHKMKQEKLQLKDRIQELMEKKVA